jgi:tetratricopeptide (TPR) repeat protein
MTPAFGAMSMGTFAWLILATAIPTQSQPAVGPLTQAGTATSQDGSLYIQAHDAQVRNDLAVALSLLDQVITLSPDFFPAYVDRGIVHYKMGQFESAASDLTKAIEFGKANSALRFAYKPLGICYRKLNRPLDAVRVYSEYLGGMGSEDWDGVAQRGEAYAQAHEAVKARQDYQRHRSLDAGAAPSFRDDAVRPLHERDKDRWIAEFCAPLGEIGISHSAGAGARATSKNLNLTGHNFLHGFLERGPADRNHSLGQRQAHQGDRLPEKEHLHGVTSLGECMAVEKGESCLGGIIRAPSALHHDLERHLSLSCHGRRTCRYHQRECCYLCQYVTTTHVGSPYCRSSGGTGDSRRESAFMLTA